MSTIEIGERLARIETKIDTLIDSTKDHEKRLRGVEKKWAWLTGILLAVTTAVEWLRK